MNTYFTPTSIGLGMDISDKPQVRKPLLRTLVIVGGAAAIERELGKVFQRAHITRLESLKELMTCSRRGPFGSMLQQAETAVIVNCNGLAEDIKILPQESSWSNRVVFYNTLDSVPFRVAGEGRLGVELATTFEFPS